MSAGTPLVPNMEAILAYGTDRYTVVRRGAEWWVMDTMPHLMAGTPHEVFNKYAGDARDRAEEVAADLNRQDRKKRGFNDDQGGPDQGARP